MLNANLKQRCIIQKIFQSTFRNDLKRLFGTEPQNKTSHYDIIIVGGGMVGTTLGCALGKNQKLANKRILLLESARKKQWNLPEKYSNRVSSLTPGTFELLKKIDAWKHIESSRFGLVKKMQVWDALSDVMITFNNDDLNEVVAYVVENDVLLSSVGKEIDNCNIDVVYESKIKNYELPIFDNDLVKINMENGSVYTGNLLLGCDGANSQVRKSMGVQYLTWNYNQMGLVATLKLSEDTENVVAWQRFLPTGPIALLPLTNNLSSLVWSTTPEQARNLVAIPENEFVQQLNDALWKEHQKSGLVNEATEMFDNFIRFLNGTPNSIRQLPPPIDGCEENSRAFFPLGFGHATNYIRKGVVLVGDAAHRVHPLAGQGVNLGFGDISCLNRILEEIVFSGNHIDNLNYLKQYETERQRHNLPTMLAIDGLHRLYNTQFIPVVLLRSLGLQATNALNPIKKAIISHAST